MSGIKSKLISGRPVQVRIGEGLRPPLQRTPASPARPRVKQSLWKVFVVVLGYIVLFPLTVYLVMDYEEKKAKFATTKADLEKTKAELERQKNRNAALELRRDSILEPGSDYFLQELRAAYPLKINGEYMRPFGGN